MADLIATERSNIVAIADAVRNKTGESGDLTIGGIISGINSIEGGGNTDIEDNIINRTISGAYVNDRITIIGECAFHYCSSLTSVSFPKCTVVSSSAFGHCFNLTSVSFPNCTIISNYAFDYCGHLTSVSFPNCATIGSAAFIRCFNLASVSFPKCIIIGSVAFGYCDHLTSVSFPNCTTIGDSAFSNCTSLTSFYLTGSSLCKLLNSTAFNDTPIGGYSALAGTYGSIYVPASLLTSYQTATNWTYFSSRFAAYDNGEDAGEDTDDLITFTIIGAKYNAKNGMTWVEWCESEYNTFGFECVGANVYYGGIATIDNVKATDVIEANASYTITIHS